jgi:hypothetical protein
LNGLIQIVINTDDHRGREIYITKSLASHGNHVPERQHGWQDKGLTGNLEFGEPLVPLTLIKAYFFLIRIMGGGVQLSPVGTAATKGLFCQPCVIMMMEKLVE